MDMQQEISGEKKEVQSMTGTCTNMQVWILTQVKHYTIVM